MKRTAPPPPPEWARCSWCGSKFHPKTWDDRHCGCKKPPKRNRHAHREELS